jgi:hypothetical protein
VEQEHQKAGRRPDLTIRLNAVAANVLWPTACRRPAASPNWFRQRLDLTVLQPELGMNPASIGAPALRPPGPPRLAGLSCASVKKGGAGGPHGLRGPRRGSGRQCLGLQG